MSKRDHRTWEVSVTYTNYFFPASFFRHTRLNEGYCFLLLYSLQRIEVTIYKTPGKGGSENERHLSPVVKYEHCVYLFIVFIAFVPQPFVCDIYAENSHARNKAMSLFLFLSLPPPQHTGGLDHNVTKDHHRHNESSTIGRHFLDPKEDRRKLKQSSNEFSFANMLNLNSSHSYFDHHPDFAPKISLGSPLTRVTCPFTTRTSFNTNHLLFSHSSFNTDHPQHGWTKVTHLETF